MRKIGISEIEDIALGASLLGAGGAEILMSVNWLQLVLLGNAERYPCWIRKRYRMML